ncbi:MAG: hypothetical protein ABI389_02885 [Rhodanobacter sp.]
MRNSAWLDTQSFLHSQADSHHLYRIARSQATRIRKGSAPAPLRWVWRLQKFSSLLAAESNLLNRILIDQALASQRPRQRRRTLPK